MIVKQPWLGGYMRVASTAYDGLGWVKRRFSGTNVPQIQYTDRHHQHGLPATITDTNYQHKQPTDVRSQALRTQP